MTYSDFHSWKFLLELKRSLRSFVDHSAGVGEFDKECGALVTSGCIKGKTNNHTLHDWIGFGCHIQVKICFSVP